LDTITARSRLPGAAPDEVPALQEAAQKQLIGKQYSAAQVGIVADVDFRNVYQHRGYLQVQFGAATTTAPDTVKPNPATTEDSGSDAPDANQPERSIILIGKTREEAEARARAWITSIYKSP
jgi:hypothetical protein